MNDQTDTQLLCAYAENRSEAAFGELVRRHMDLVYSAALRMVCDSHLAEDVTQGVFVALAKNADQLTNHPVLSGWLHRTAQNIAAQTVRTDVRRRNREQEAAAMKELLSANPDASWAEVSPQLDAALGDLSEPDRDAILLRYFERKSAKDMGLLLGISDEAAQKRVNRAVDRLRDNFAQRGVTIGAGGLVLLISAHGVQAAPVGLALTITTAATLGGSAVTAATTTAATTTIQTIAMTTFQKIAVTTALTAALGVLIYENHQNSALREQYAATQKLQTELTAQVQGLQRERDDALQQQAALREELAALKKAQPQTEVLRLRGEVGVLKRDNETIAKKTPMSKLTASPEARKLIREQQKMGMGAIFGELSKNTLKLDEENLGKFNDLLADYIMENIDITTQALQDKSSRNEIDHLFKAQEAALNDKVLALLGQEGLNQFQDYSRNLLGSLTAQQFEGSLNGDKEAKAQKKTQLAQLMQEETQAALIAAGLPANYPTVPILNFRNIASEQQAEANLKMMDGIFDRVTARSTGFLDEKELTKLQEFRTKALENNRTILQMNRQMMAPIAQ